MGSGGNIIEKFSKTITKSKVFKFSDIINDMGLITGKTFTFSEYTYSASPAFNMNAGFTTGFVNDSITLDTITDISGLLSDPEFTVTMPTYFSSITPGYVTWKVSGTISDGTSIYWQPVMQITGTHTAQGYSNMDFNVYDSTDSYYESTVYLDSKAVDKGCWSFTEDSSSAVLTLSGNTLSVLSENIKYVAAYHYDSATNSSRPDNWMYFICDSPYKSDGTKFSIGDATGSMSSSNLTVELVSDTTQLTYNYTVTISGYAVGN